MPIYLTLSPLKSAMVSPSITLNTTANSGVGVGVCVGVGVGVGVGVVVGVGVDIGMHVGIGRGGVPNIISSKYAMAVTSDYLVVAGVPDVGRKRQGRALEFDNEKEAFASFMGTE